jgi:hypothetical protein
MDSWIYLFDSASSDEWSSPANALDSDADRAAFAAQGGDLGGSNSRIALSNPRRIGNKRIPEDHSIDGILAEIRGLSDEGALTGFRGKKDVYQAAIEAMDEDGMEGDLTDLDLTGTYWGHSSLGTAGVDRYLTLIIDLGEPKGFASIQVHYFRNIADGPRIIETSNDAENWTEFTDDEGTADGFQGGWVTHSRAQFADLTRRFIRISLTDDVGAGQGQLKIGDIEIRNLANSEISPNNANEAKIEVFLSKNGSTADGDIREIELGTSDGAHVLGGIADLWNSTLEIEDFEDGLPVYLVARRKEGDDQEYSASREIAFGFVAVFSSNKIIVQMSDRPTSAQFSIIAKEVTPGTAVAPDTRLRASMVRFQPQVEQADIEYQGDTLAGDSAILAEGSEGTLEGFPTYDELGLLFAAAFGKPNTQDLGNGAYRHQFIFDPRAASDLQTYTHEFGDANTAERVTYAVMAALGLSIARRSTSLSGRFLARRIEDQGSGLAAGSNATQTITITGAPTGGDYKLRFQGEETAVIAFDATNATIESALEALSGIGVGEATVTGAGPFTVTFSGALGGTAQPILELAENNLTGGTSPTVDLAITNLGGYTELNCEPILPGHWNGFYASTIAGLSGGKLTKLYSAELELDGRKQASWVIDSSKQGMDGAADDSASLRCQLKVQADAAAQAMATDARDRVKKYLQLKAEGGTIPGGGSELFTCEITLSGKARLIENFDDEDGVYAREFSFGTNFDETWGQACQVILKNEVASY